MSIDTIKLDGWIETSKGNRFDYATPENYKFNTDEIAHALSQLCRFTGHTKEFYSVAQHSIMVSNLLPYNLRLLGLLHDAAEAFIGDINAPLKQLLPQVKELENRIQAAIYKQYGVAYTAEAAAMVKEADIMMLLTEKRDLMPGGMPVDKWGDWVKQYKPIRCRIEPWTPEYARDRFIDECLNYSR